MSARRFFSLLGLGVGVLVAETTLLGLVSGLLPFRIVPPELALLVVLCVGLKAQGSHAAHVGFAVALGYLTDLFGGGPTGLYAFTLALVMVLARAAASFLLVTSWWQILFVSTVAALGHGAVLVALNGGAESGEHWLMAVLLFRSVLATVLCAPPLFRLLSQIDRRLLRREWGRTGVSIGLWPHSG